MSRKKRKTTMTHMGSSTWVVRGSGAGGGRGARCRVAPSRQA